MVSKLVLPASHRRGGPVFLARLMITQLKQLGLEATQNETLDKPAHEGVSIVLLIALKFRVVSGMGRPCLSSLLSEIFFAFLEGCKFLFSPI